MRVQVARPAEHAAIAELPYDTPLETWQLTNVHPVGGLHRHVVKLVEYPQISYVVKELPDDLASSVDAVGNSRADARDWIIDRRVPSVLLQEAMLPALRIDIEPHDVSPRVDAPRRGLRGDFAPSEARRTAGRFGVARDIEWKVAVLLREGLSGDEQRA